MVHTVPAPSTKTTYTRGRGNVSQSEAGGQPTSTQERTEGAKASEETKAEEGSNESEDKKDRGDDDKQSESTSSMESETKEPAKTPAKTKAPTQSSADDNNEGKEGMTDDNEFFPQNVDVRRKVHELAICLHKGATGERCAGYLASQMARATEDFGTPRKR